MSKIDRFDAYAMKKAGYTLREIAKKYYVSHEAVRLLLKRSFPNTKFEDLKKVEKIDFVCPQCKKTLKLYKNSKQKTCSRKCASKRLGELVRISGKPTSSKYATKEQKREFNRIRASEFYHKHKHDPEYIKYKRDYEKERKRKEKLEFEKYKEFYLKNHKKI